MNDDDDLTDPGEIGSYRNDGSSTMLAGAHAIAEQLNTLRGRVIRLFKHHGPMTDRELVEAYTETYGPCEYRSISTRRRELVDRGFIVDTGKSRVNPHSGVANIVWALTVNEQSLPDNPYTKRGEDYRRGFYNGAFAVLEMLESELSPSCSDDWWRDVCRWRRSGEKREPPNWQDYY